MGNTKRSERRSGPLAKKDEKVASKHVEKLEELNTLLHPSQEGDKQALSRPREILDEFPELANGVVDPAEQAKLSMVMNYAGDDPLVKEVLPRTLEAMRAELAGENPSPLERLLVERVVATWFQLQYFEALYAQHCGELTIRQSDYHQRRLDRAHRRYLSAIRTLAQVRKLLKPTVAQINIADKQVNLAAGSEFRQAHLHPEDEAV